MTSTAPPTEGREAPRWLRWLARVGIAAEGTIYVLIGGLALAGAFDPSERPSGTQGAMSRLADGPLGRPQLALLGLGLAAFVLWQLVLSVLDPECTKERWSMKRIALRIHHVWNAALHCVLAGIAAWLLLGHGGGGEGGQAPKQLAAVALRLPYGQWLLGAVGVGIVLFALVQCFMACRPHKTTRMTLGNTPMRIPILALLTFGYLARGTLFGLIGAFLLYAAWRYDSDHVMGVSGALQSMRDQPYGPLLLGAVAAGLIAFGLAQIAKARYRKIRIE